MAHIPPAFIVASIFVLAITFGANMVAWAVVVLVFAASLGSLRLAISSGHRISGCGAHTGCHEVMTSRWSRLGPIPVAALGVVLYSIVGIAAVLNMYGSFSIQEWAADTSLVLAILAGGGALWFVGLQALVLRKFCGWCMTIYALGFTAAALTLVLILQNSVPTDGHVIPITIGSALCVVLVGTQLIVHPKTYRMIETPTLPATTTNAVPVRSEEGKAKSPIRLAGGKVLLNQDGWPVLGSADADRKIALLFDVTCNDCRRLHRLLAQELRAGNSKLAVFLIPVPLNPSCNPAVVVNRPEYEEACAHARLLLALWDLNPEDFADFDEWVMATERAPSIHEARRAADEFVNPLRRAAALTSSSIDERIRHGVEIFRGAVTDQLPQLLLAERVVIGPVNNSEDLRTLLEGTAR